MSAGRDGRLPGDAPEGDPSFGPVGGLPDQVHHFVHDQERAADTAGERLLRRATIGADRPASLIERVRAAVSRLRRPT